MASYLYLEPTIKTKSAVSGVLFIILITVAIMQYVHIYINWDKKQVQCKLDNISIAYLTGNIETWLEKCVK